MSIMNGGGGGGGGLPWMGGLVRDPGRLLRDRRKAGRGDVFAVAKVKTA